MNPALTTRFIPTRPANNWLQWQAGVIESRHTQLATYAPNHGHFTGFKTGPKEPVFRLTGWGVTEEAAMRMAEGRVRQ